MGKLPELGRRPIELLDEYAVDGDDVQMRVECTTR
jgi:hypothetical protein